MNESPALAVGVSATAAVAVLLILAIILIIVTIVCVVYRRSRKVNNKELTGLSSLIANCNNYS